MAFSFFHTLVHALALSSSALAVTNPSGFLLRGGFADPRTTYYDGVYYGFATYKQDVGPEPKVHVPVATSQAFASGWSYSAANILPTGPAWATTEPAIWDPMLHVYNSTHCVLYYAALSSTNGPDDEVRHCIGTAASTTVLGNYTPAATPLVCGAAEGVQYIASKPDALDKDRYSQRPARIWTRGPVFPTAFRSSTANDIHVRSERRRPEWC